MNKAFTRCRHAELDSASSRSMKGFTLIELLVVVLIIGILAAVALPQYQKAVEKARVAEAIVALRSLYQSNVSYYLENGERPTKISQLEMDLPWTGSYDYLYGASSDRSISNEDWSLGLYHADTNLDGVCVVRIRGAYAGGGFCMYHRIPSSGGDSVLNAGQLYCVERRSGSAVVLQGDAGDYCKKLFHAKRKAQGNVDAYILP